MSDAPLLVVGLGNPGAEYEGNRHNIGFMAVDAVADAVRFPSWRRKFKGLITEGKVGDRKVVLLKPDTYMNLSGAAVAEVARFYKIPPGDVIVLHDELDLAPAKLRVKAGGGTAGHNGLKSIEQHLGTADFRRVRIGIGHPGDKDRVSDYVLSDFAKAEREWVAAMVDAIAKNIGVLVDGQPELFMTRVAEAMPREKEEKKDEK